MFNCTMINYQKMVNFLKYKVNFQSTEVKQFTIVIRYNTIFALLMPVAGLEPSVLGL